MNPTIKKLMKEANLQPYYEGQEKDIEKFAGLIIKESCDLLHNNNRAYTESVTMLKKYFGIE